MACVRPSLHGRVFNPPNREAPTIISAGTEEAHSQRQFRSDRNPRVQLLHPWSLEERDRLGLSAPWGQRLVWEISGDHGAVSRRNRNRSGPICSLARYLAQI